MKFAACLAVVATVAASVVNAVPQILGGTVVPVGQKTYAVGLRPSAANDTLCGGVLISPTKVLTAAQCADNAQLAAIGSHYNSGHKDGELIKVKKQMIHPQYDPSNFAFDFNILELAQASKVKPAKLSTANAESFKNSVATAIGWGLTAENGRLSKELRRVNVPLVPVAQCQKMLKLTNPLPSTLFCAGGEQDKDACAGDNGGSIIREASSGDVVIGLNSGGIGCGVKGNPGLYSNVASVKKWILSLAPDAVFV